MSLKWWKRLNFSLLVVVSVMTVFCVTPGPGQELGQNLVYLTFISHLALILTCFATVAGIRSEESE